MGTTPSLGAHEMSKISEFFGISIHMFHREHPPPHFHARYAGEEAFVSVDDLSVMHGWLPPRVLGLVIEWASQHQSALRHIWAQAERHQPLDRIPPLV